MSVLFVSWHCLGLGLRGNLVEVGLVVVGVLTPVDRAELEDSSLAAGAGGF